MRKKFLHVALIVASMAVICCVFAFAEMPYPDNLPAAPEAVSGYSYVIVSYDGGGISYKLVYCDNGSSLLFDGGRLVFDPSYGGTGYGIYNLHSSGVWKVQKVFTKYDYSLDTIPTNVSLDYANYDVYDKSGNLVYAGAPYVPPDPNELFLGNLGEVASSVLSYVGDVCETIVNEPVLLITMGILLLGGSVGIFRRLLSRG